MSTANMTRTDNPNDPAAIAAAREELARDFESQAVWAWEELSAVSIDGCWAKPGEDEAAWAAAAAVRRRDYRAAYQLAREWWAGLADRVRETARLDTGEVL